MRHSHILKLEISRVQSEESCCQGMAVCGTSRQSQVKVCEVFRGCDKIVGVGFQK